MVWELGFGLDGRGEEEIQPWCLGLHESFKVLGAASILWVFLSGFLKTACAGLVFSGKDVIVLRLEESPADVAHCFGHFSRHR